MNIDTARKCIDQNTVIEIKHGIMYFGKVVGINKDAVHMQVIDELSEASDKCFPLDTIINMYPKKHVSFVPLKSLYSPLVGAERAISQHIESITKKETFLITTKKHKTHNGKDRKIEWSRYNIIPFAFLWLESDAPLKIHPSALIELPEEQYLIGICDDAKAYKIAKDGKKSLLA